MEEAIKTTGTDIRVSGDSKMSALATRAHLHGGGSRSLTPLARVGNTTEERARGVEAAGTGAVAEPAVEAAAHEPMGRGAEVRREQTSRANDSAAPVHWHERGLVLQSEE